MRNTQKTFTINLNSSLSNPNSKPLKLTYVTNNYLCYGDYSGSLIGKANVEYLKYLLGAGNLYMLSENIRTADTSALTPVIAEYTGTGLGYFPLALEERYAYSTTALWVLTPESVEIAKLYDKDCQALIALEESTIAVLKAITDPEGDTILDEAGYYALLEDYREEYLQDVTVPDVLKELNDEVEAKVSEAEAEAFDLWCEENTDIVLEILRDTCSFFGEYPGDGGYGLATFGFYPSKAYKVAVRAAIYDAAQEELNIKLPV